MSSRKANSRLRTTAAVPPLRIPPSPPLPPPTGSVQHSPCCPNHRCCPCCLPNHCSPLSPPHTQAKQDASELQEASKGLKAKIAEIEEREKAVIAERDAALVPIGNVVHDSVPISDNEVGLGGCLCVTFVSVCGSVGLFGGGVGR